MTIPEISRVSIIRSIIPKKILMEVEVFSPLHVTLLVILDWVVIYFLPKNSSRPQKMLPVNVYRIKINP